MMHLIILLYNILYDTSKSNKISQDPNEYNEEIV